jgi:pimeloyl-ACP methyl ester carboxylesterase
MVLNTRHWGDPGASCVVCVHGLTHDGSVFDEMAWRLASLGHFVLAVDLRGHGESGFEPPWNEETHVRDLLETLDSFGVRRATWVGHSFGGRLAATIAGRHHDRAERLAMLEPGLRSTPAQAARGAETERLDWSFATVDGIVEAILSHPLTVAAPREAVAAFATANARKGSDGRYRLRCSPAALVVAWSELTLPPPPVARCPTLVVKASDATVVDVALLGAYEESLGDRDALVEVPGGHNLLWEAPRQTLQAVELLLARAPDRGAPTVDRA